MDVVLGAGLLLVFLPVLILAAVAIRAGSPGPALFSQARIGLDGRQFAALKLRTMKGAVATVPLLSDGTLVKPETDPRITSVGRILRRTSIDELPQLFNVVIGQMSLVGPRPLVPHMLAPYPRFASVRNMVRPGITGLWQIRDRANATHVRFMAHHDLEYIANFSLRQDLMILLLTPLRVLSGRGAR